MLLVYVSDKNSYTYCSCIVLNTQKMGQHIVSHHIEGLLSLGSKKCVKNALCGLGHKECVYYDMKTFKQNCAETTVNGKTQCQKYIVH